MPPRSTKEVGSIGERLAAEYLISQGYVIRERNWRYSNIGELDIVAEDRDWLVFVEVRTRSRVPELAEQSVNAAKQRRLISLAYAWLDEHGLSPDTLDWRIDVLAVQLDRDGARFSLYQNAVTELSLSRVHIALDCFDILLDYALRQHISKRAEQPLARSVI